MDTGALSITPVGQVASSRIHYVVMGEVYKNNCQQETRRKVRVKSKVSMRPRAKTTKKGLFQILMRMDDHFKIIQKIHKAQQERKTIKYKELVKKWSVFGGYPH